MFKDLCKEGKSVEHHLKKEIQSLISSYWTLGDTMGFPSFNKMCPNLVSKNHTGDTEATQKQKHTPQLWHPTWVTWSSSPHFRFEKNLPRKEVMPHQSSKASLWHLMSPKLMGQEKSIFWCLSIETTIFPCNFSNGRWINILDVTTSHVCLPKATIRGHVQQCPRNTSWVGCAKHAAYGFLEVSPRLSLFSFLLVERTLCLTVNRTCLNRHTIMISVFDLRGWLAVILRSDFEKVWFW